LHAPSTWHYGLIADYWALNNLEAPELEIYEPHLHSPVLDAGCGSGRLLAPLHEHGFDIAGCDVSADMLERCRRRVPDVTLWVSALHELDPPRRYASIVCSGVFGLGSTREQDIQALGRLHDALLPGGPPGDGRHLPGQHPGHVLDGLAPADVGGLAVDHERVAAELGDADGEGHPGP